MSISNFNYRLQFPRIAKTLGSTVDTVSSILMAAIDLELLFITFPTVIPPSRPVVGPGRGTTMSNLVEL